MITRTVRAPARLAAAACACVCLAGILRAAPEVAEPIKGITEPYRNVTLRSGGKRNPPWTTKIAKIYVEEGDHVEAGQLLMEMDKSQEELELKIRQTIANSYAELHGAQEKEHTLGELYQASRELYEKTKSISLEDLDRKQLEYQIAVAESQRLAVAKVREKAEAALAADELGRRTLRSPIRGTVVRLFLREGESCEPSDPLVQIVDTSRGYFIGNVEEKVGRTLNRGDVVDLALQTGTTSTATTGSIVFVAPVVDPASGLLTLKVEFQNPDGKVRPGVPGSMSPRPHAK